MIEVRAYQGLIHNYKELAEELSVNIEACSRNEREKRLLIAAFLAWGEKMGLHINGQFGLALFDTQTQELFCTRDILGAELFFYYLTKQGTLLYGTQIKDLFTQEGFCRELNEELIQFYLGFSYVPGEETLYKGVNKLEPGGFLRYSVRGLQLGRYWELEFDPDETKTLDEWADEIAEAMDKSLQSICDADEEPDTFLSGGVDSSFILAKSRARTAYCVSYEDQKVSEEEQACATAHIIGREFAGIEVSPEEFFATLDEFLLAFEQPTSDAAGLALYCACKKVSQKSTLCFSGEGADEFFAGYNGYQHTARFEKKANPVYYGATQAMREFDQKHYLKHYSNAYSPRDFIRTRGAAGRQYDTVSWMLYVDLRSYFEGSILFNSTKISQGTGLDIRMPFCDLRIFDIARRMPSRYKVNAQGNKLALRKAASSVLPQEIAYRKKLGFPVPIKDWLANPAYNSDIRRAFESDAATRFFEPKELKALFSMFIGEKTNLWHQLRYRNNTAPLWRRVWSIYVFIRWYELFFLQG